MGRLKRVRPSPAIAIAVMALVAAIAGTALADPRPTSSAVTKQKVKKIARKQVNKLAPGLSVANAVSAESAATAQTAANAANATNAANADTVDGKHASELQTSSGFAENPNDTEFTDEFEDVVSTPITTTSTRVMAVGSVFLQQDGADPENEAVCRIQIDGVNSTTYSQDLADNEEATMTITFARELGPGTHSVALQCLKESGGVESESAGLSAWAVGS
jgi:methionine-rich copper-binding protein CopC